MRSNIIRIILAIVILVALVIFFVVKFYIFKKADLSVGSKKAEITMITNDLVKDFETDEKIANTKYLNKIIAVKGLVDNVAETKADFTVYLKEKGASSGVTCSFDKMEFQKKPVKKGDQVNIKGICSGYLMDVVLNKCAVEK